MHTHHTRDRRAALAALMRAGYAQAHAARVLGVDPSTVSRELARNANADGSYDARHAERKARERRTHAKASSRSIEGHPLREALIEALLAAHHSPEQIAGAFGVSTHTTIYAWIERSRPDLKRFLRRRGRKRRKYGEACIPSRYQAAKRQMAERPRIVERRKRIGDWEGDTARGGDRKSALVVHTERTSGFVVAAALPRATADAVHETVRRMLRHVPVETITYDNGSEFALHKMIEKDLHARVYFARPGRPPTSGERARTPSASFESSSRKARDLIPYKPVRLRERCTISITVLANGSLGKPRVRCSATVALEALIQHKLLTPI